MAVEGGDYRPGESIELQQDRVQLRHKSADVLSPALEKPKEIHTGREDTARAGHDQGFYRLVFQLGELSGDFSKQLQVHRVGLAMLDPNDGNGAPVFSGNHGWPTVLQKMSWVLDFYPKVKGVQMMNGNPFVRFSRIQAAIIIIMRVIDMTKHRELG